jgi:hypothetical protein
MTDLALLDQLRRTAEELRQAFADERSAIAALDHARLEALASLKQALATNLTELHRRLPDPGLPVVRDLFAAIRLEAQATSMLARTAAEAVRGLLGYESTGGYDRRAKTVTRGPSRYLATY